MKKALIVSPYLDHLGGGERYMLSAASALESFGYQVFFAWDNTDEINNLASMLGITLANPALDPPIKKLYFGSNPLSMYRATRPYDVVIYLSDGSLPLLGGKRNLVHMQVPFHGVSGKSWQNRLKQHFIHSVIVNSAFTKQVIDAEYGLDSIVIYPPVTPIVDSGKKGKMILSVGRFEPSLNTKHQDVLIKAFRSLSPSLPGWTLTLAGACSSDDWLTQLRRLADGLPINFLVNCSYADLCHMYQEAAIYWHAAGYEVDEVKNPELTEHFGISTVEAISAGCIPLVVPYGGQREIITSNIYHWQTMEELVQKTREQIDQPVMPSVNISLYSVANFKEHLSRLIQT